MEIIHFSDLHLGNTAHGKIDPETGLNTRVLDYLESLDVVVEYTQRAEPDLVVFAGDAFHHHNPQPTYVAEFGKRIKQISDVCPVVIVPGNHDMTASKTTSALEVFGVMGTRNVHVIEQAWPIIPDTKNGSINVACFPYPHKRHYLDGKRYADKLDERAAYMDMLIERLELIETQLERGIPSMFVGHFTIAGCRYGSEKGIALGEESEMLIDYIARPCYDYVAMGHIHFCQNLTKGAKGIPPVVYAGSLDRIDFGEEHDKKGFCHVTISKQGTSYRFVSVDPRPMVTLRYNLDKHPTGMISKLREQLVEDTDPDAIVRVIISTKDRSLAIVEDVYQALEKLCHSLYVKVESTIAKQLVRLALPNDTERIPMTDVLKLYLQEAKQPPEEIDVLLDLFEEILEDVE